MIDPDSPRADKMWSEYARRFRKHVLENLKASKVAVAIFEADDGSASQVRFATTIGMMILMDKPMVVIVPRGVAVPPKLKLIADHLVEDADMDDPGTQDRLAEVFRALGPDLWAEPKNGG